MYKKGDIADLRHYGPISLLPHVYQLFMEIITKRHDIYRPRNQAGFGGGHGTNDHLQVI